MTKKILLDTNLLISALDTKTPKAIKYLRNLLEDDNVALAISPLIRYEVLRGVAFENNQLHDKLQLSLNGFEEFDITAEVAKLSSDLFRYAKSKKRNIVDKRSFDVFHLCTARCNNLELDSNDGDLPKLQKLYDEYTATI